MPQELNGHGPTAGESMGGTGANLNERPDNSTPGGGHQGNAGDRDKGNKNSHAAAYQRQINAIRNDPAIKNMLADLIKRTRSINPSAKVSLTKLDESGSLDIMVSGVNREQVESVLHAFQSTKPAIKNAPVTSLSSSVSTGVFGTVATGHKISNYQSSLNGNNNGNDTAAENKV
ncbi:MAG: hypothetical protein HYZ77_00780, partial [Serratia liquefaciens]|nr:hypothetical protein [Serratia liquefaciens]